MTVTSTHRSGRKLLIAEAVLRSRMLSSSFSSNLKFKWGVYVYNIYWEVMWIRRAFMHTFAEEVARCLFSKYLPTFSWRSHLLLQQGWVWHLLAMIVTPSSDTELFLSFRGNNGYNFFRSGYCAANWDDRRGGVLFCQVWQFNVADSPSNGQW